MIKEVENFAKERQGKEGCHRYKESSWLNFVPN